MLDRGGGKVPRSLCTISTLKKNKKNNNKNNNKNNILKGQVTFLKLCLLVVCLAVIIPRFTLFLINNRFQAEKCIYMPVPA